MRPELRETDLREEFWKKTPRTCGLIQHEGCGQGKGRGWFPRRPLSGTSKKVILRSFCGLGRQTGPWEKGSQKGSSWTWRNGRHWVGAVTPHVWSPENLWDRQPLGPTLDLRDQELGLGAAVCVHSPLGDWCTLKSDNPESAGKERGGHPTTVCGIRGDGAGHVAVEWSLGEWSLISHLAGQARELRLGSAGRWEPLLVLEQRCDKVFESFRKLNQMVRGPDDTEEVEPKGRPPDSASQAGGTRLQCLWGGGGGLD